MMKIELKVLNKEFYEEHLLPSYATNCSAAVDLICTKDIVIYSGETRMIDTGVAIWIGSIGSEWVDWCSVVGLIAPLSGLGSKGLILANTIGVIDEDYQGELKISAWNRLASQVIELKAGDRIAQLFFVPVIKAQWNVVEDFTSATSRGSGGFGSTGV
jgi:dUTP pyrophosphatase